MSAFGVDHLKDGAAAVAAAVALVGAEHLVLLARLARLALALAGEEVDDVGVAVVVGAAAEAVLTAELVDLAGEEVGLVREALVRLHEDLEAPALREVAAEVLLGEAGDELAARHLDRLRDEDVTLELRGLGAHLGLHAGLALRADDEGLLPAGAVGEGDVEAREPVLVAAARLLVLVDVDDHHLHGEPVAVPSLRVPRVLDLGAHGDGHLEVVAVVLELDVGHVERAGRVDRVRRVGVLARALVVALRVLERDGLARERRAGAQGHRQGHGTTDPKLHRLPPRERPALATGVVDPEGHGEAHPRSR